MSDPKRQTAEHIARVLSCGRRGCRCGKKQGKEWRTHCQAHSDEEPSLYLTDADGGKVLVRCMAGCSQEAVIDALRERGLWSSGPARPKRAREPIVRHKLRDASGQVIAVHCRQGSGADKRVWWKLPDGTKGLKGKPVEELPLYGCEKLDILPAGASVVVTEGEKDADSLNGRDVAAVGTVTGASGTPCRDSLAALMDYSVILWPDADDAGRKHMKRIAQRRMAMGHQDVRIVEWADAPAKGGAADFTGSDDELRALLDAARPYESPPAVDLAALLEDVRAFIRKYVVLSDAQADAAVLWTAHTHALDRADTTPYLAITSAEKRSGKSRLLEVLSLMVARPWLTGRATTAVLIRKMAKDTPTLLLDESDAAFNGEKEYAETLRAVLNAGYRRGGVASMCVKSGGDFELRDFPVFGPKAIGGIGKLPDTIADRAIPIVLKRKAPGERAARFKWRHAQSEAAPLQENLAAWSAALDETLVGAEPDIPVELDDRAAEGWEPLLAIADAAGNEWPERARRAAQKLSVGDSREDDSLGVRLLADIWNIFTEKKVDRITSAHLVKALVRLEEAPWGDLRGRPISPRTLARFLGRGRFDIKPRVIRVGDATPRGYAREDFEDAWDRYLACAPVTGATSATSATVRASRFDLAEEVVADVADVAANTGMGKQDDDDGRRRYARSLWAKLDRPASLSLNGWKRIVDAEKFIANAGADDLAAIIELLEEIAGAG